MSRTKKCRKCGEVLYCRECGARQTPEVPDWARLSLSLTRKQKRVLEELAKEAGVSVSEFIRRRLNDDENPSED